MLHGETGVFQKTTPCLLYTRGTASGGSLPLLTGALEAQWATAKSRTRAVQPQARLGTGVAATLSTREALPARACLPIPVATRRPVPTSERARVEGSLGSSACMLPFSIFPVGASSAARLTYPKKCTLMWVSWPPCCASLTSAAQAPPKPTRQHRMLPNSTPMGQLFDRGLHLRLFDPSVGFRLIPVLRRRATNFHFISPQSSARQQRGN